ncbi:NEDD4-binding protein 2-like 2 isoform X2 [Nerophis ophidion]|uniref:NEDD4-binding protein 2-like 2 isoform X2 n=1 Tax=Nerophis ophidion TaxID=159077 RepID=UPI002AE034B3|nr:NEDD4-binding protein 2-like 2 isoform X2 [Nerophis ophidion]
MSEEDTSCGNKETSSKEDDSTAKESTKDNDYKRVLKQVGITSSAFIGPSFQPEKNTPTSDVEDTLTAFYKEIEEICEKAAEENDARLQTAQASEEAQDTPVEDTFRLSEIDSPQQRSSAHKEAPWSRPVEDTVRLSEIDSPRQRSSAHKEAPWSHWYNNEPYYTKRPKNMNSDRFASNQNPPLPPLNQPEPRLHHPPFPNYTPPPQHWYPTSDHHYQQFPAPECHHYPPQPQPRFPAPECNPVYQDRHCGGSSFDARDDVNARWSRDAPELHFEDRCQAWEQPSHSGPLDGPSLVLILMRGLPGSGKSTMARELLSTGPSGLILSTDDYFEINDGYDPGLLGAAHEWNQRRASNAMHDSRSPIIIDNTNLQAWEMKPYALQRGYRVDFCEPNTSWKFDPFELEKRNKHGVTQKKIAKMLDRFFSPVSIDDVMSSQEPHHVNQRRQK